GPRLDPEARAGGGRLVLRLSVGLTLLLMAASCRASHPAGQTDQTVNRMQRERLSEKMERAVLALHYPPEVASATRRHLLEWRDFAGRSVVESWSHTLVNAQGQVSEDATALARLTQKEKQVISEIARYLRRRFRYQEGAFELMEILESRQAQCLGYTQLFYVVTQSLGLASHPIDVIVDREPGMISPGEGHVSCLVDLSDGSSVLLDLVPNGLISAALSLDEDYRKEGPYHELKDEKNPLGLFRKIQVLDADGLYAHILNSRTLKLESHQATHAVSLFTAAIQLNPDFAAGYSNRAIMLARLEAFDEALADCEQALTINPLSANAHNVRGTVLVRLGKFPEAMAAFDRAIQLQPDYAKAICNRGSAYNKLRRHERALDDFEKALRLEGASSLSYYNRGIALYRLGRYREAIASYSSALRQAPQLQQAHVNRALCYALVGKDAKARQDLQSAIELDPKMAEPVGRISRRFSLGVRSLRAGHQ
ncbi:MAG: tetratricopeptide repeat protein, partial [Planctomycetes bacterium]|nr:tetratricopeptide repeat protein [Planctomycetota bacterium]